MTMLVDQVPCSVLMTDTKGQIQFANSSLLQLIGETVEFWHHKQLEDLLPPASRIFLQTHLMPMLYQESQLQEIHLRIYDHQRQSVPVLVNCQKSTHQNQACYLWVFFVAHERSKFEAELLKARREAQQMAEALAQANIELSILHEQLSLHVKDVETKNAKLTTLSERDPLTGLCNRRALENHVSNGLLYSDNVMGASILMVDVDHFKQTNDQHGHDEGDRVLVELAQQLQRSIQEKDLAVRYGGEEFIILLPSSDRVRAESIAQFVHENVHHITVMGKPITVSIGVASSVEQMTLELLHQMITHADKAVYEAKHYGRNCTRHYSG